MKKLYELGIRKHMNVRCLTVYVYCRIIMSNNVARARVCVCVCVCALLKSLRVRISSLSLVSTSSHSSSYDRVVDVAVV